MTATEMLIQLTEKQIARLFEIARSLPADKLDWKPTPGSRSALDQLQEVATALPRFWSAYTERKIEWDQQKFLEWHAERSKITSLDELERLAKESTAKLSEFLRDMDTNDLTADVEMPFPGKFNLADVLAYHYWNAAYHEGQIMFIKGMLEES